MRRVRAAIIVALIAAGALAPAAHADYRDVVLADDPAGYWRLEEASGPLGRNEVPGGQRLRYVQHPLLDEDGAFAGSRAATAGFRSLLDVGPPVRAGRDATYETWFRIQPGPFGQNYEHVLEVPGDWGVWVYDGHLYAGCQRGSWGWGPAFDGDWHHLAVRLTANRLEVFRDGVRVVATSCDYDRGAERVVAGWGGGRTFVRPLARSYDEIAMYDRALPDERIAAHAAARTAADAGPGKVRAPLTGGAYTTQVLADRPFSYYRLDDRPWTAAGAPSFHVEDSSGNGRHATMQLGGMDRPAGPIAAEQRNLAIRPRTHGFFAAAPAAASVSVESWVKLVNEDAIHLNTWLKGGRFGLYFHGVELGALPWGGLSLLDNLWSDRAWHHVVVTKDAAADEVRVYRDGRLHRTIADANDAPLFGAGDEMLIGGGDALNAGFCLDEVAVYESVLSAERVAAHYDAADAELAAGGCGGTPDVRPDQRPAPPANVSRPSVRGVAEPGNVVWCDPGEWTGSPTHFRQQWRRDGRDVLLGTEWAHLVTAADDGHSLTCHVVAVGPGGDSTEAQSNALVASGRPLAPGAPRLADPGADLRAAVALVWDPTPAEPVPADGYVVERQGADGIWHVVSRPDEPRVTLHNQPEGLLRYRVHAHSGGTPSDRSPVSDPMVVDRTPPRPARLDVAGAPAWTSPAGEGWYRGSVSATWHDEGDPDLPDGTPGTGVDPATLPAPVALTATGTHAVAAHLRDRARNVSVTAQTLRVDADPPALALQCPPVAHVGAIAHVVVTGGDGAGSGLTAPLPAELTIDTATIGVRTLSLAARDNVGHETTRSCSVPVLHRRPSAPRLVAGASPGAGAIGLAWSRHAGAPAPAAYVLERRDADDAAWTEVARGTAESWSTPAGSPLPEGTWTFRVRVEDPRFDPEPSEPSDPVVVDRTAPAAPAIAPGRAADAPGDWYRDAVTVGFAGAGDPALPDGSPGSGVDPASVPAAATYATAGAHTASGAVRDRAGNPSPTASRTVHVDTTAPSASIVCPSSDVVQDSAATAAWTASDTGSGLAGPASGTVALATGAIGTHTASPPEVRDRVGHVAPAATCGYRVVYAFEGFFAPLVNPPDVNWVGAGEVVPVVFRLNGDRGLGVLAGEPSSAPASCGGRRETVAWTLPLTWPGLRLSSGSYTWGFRTDASWSNSCRELVVGFADGTSRRLLFRFLR
jgi:hypothetical protein